MEESQWSGYITSANTRSSNQQYPMVDEVLISKKDYHDNHYATMDVQPIEIIQDILTPEQLKGYLIGQIIKYRMRAGHKQGEKFSKDIDKLTRYREWLLQVQAGIKIDPRV